MKWTDIIMVSFFPVVLAGILIYYNYTSYTSWKNQKNLAEDGISAQARIIKKTEFSSTKGGDSFSLEYEYTIKGEKYSKTMEVPENTYNIHRENGSLDIVYLQKNPNVSNLPNNSRTSFKIWLILVLDMVIASALYFGYMKYK